MSVSHASLSGLAQGTARGGAPSARIAAYKVCWQGGCLSHNVLSAFDDAIADGVDIISLSLGHSTARNYFEDPIAIGSFHAMQNRILTVHSAGNDGPGLSTTASVAPWLMSVASSTTDRAFTTLIKLGNGQFYNGVSANIFDLNGKMYPLIYGGDAPNTAENKNYDSSRLCEDNSLDPSLVMGKIVLCDQPIDGNSAIIAGAVGAISIGCESKYLAKIGAVPYSCIGKDDGVAVYRYTKLSNGTATATIFKSTTEVTGPISEAPFVARTSSRGPNNITGDLLKPDISAPGAAILAAFSRLGSISGVEKDTRKVQFSIMSGTSMACPHVSAIAAYIKSHNPNWSPSFIKSALMTTATPMNESSSPGSALAYGAGHLNPRQALSPGLVYEVSQDDYISFLCGQEYTSAQLQNVTGRWWDFCLPFHLFEKSPRDLNLPSFALLVDISQPFHATFKRTVGNVGPLSSTTYYANVSASNGVEITVQPSELTFDLYAVYRSFVVTVHGTIETDVSSALVWSDGVHSVRSPIVIYTRK